MADQSAISASLGHPWASMQPQMAKVTEVVKRFCSNVRANVCGVARIALLRLFTGFLLNLCTARFKGMLGT